MAVVSANKGHFDVSGVSNPESNKDDVVAFVEVFE